VYINDLLTEKSLNRPGLKLQSKKAVVLHYVGNPNTSPKNNIHFWRNRTDFGSAHIVIGIDGESRLAIPFDEVGYHCGTRTPVETAVKIFGLTTARGMTNYHSVGIELCHKEWKSPYTQKTLDELSWTLDHLKSFGFEYLITHNEVSGKNCDFWFRTNKDELIKLAEKHGFLRP